MEGVQHDHFLGFRPDISAPRVHQKKYFLIPLCKEMFEVLSIDAIFLLNMNKALKGFPKFFQIFFSFHLLFFEICDY